MTPQMVRGIPTTVLVAPDSFKGTLSATEVACAIGRGLRAGGREIDTCPLADGGEGTLAALSAPLCLSLVHVEVSDPLGRPVQAAYGLDPSGRTAVVEMAQASGLWRVSEADRDAVASSTYGTGELIAAAVQAGATELYVSVGGSATSDGGAGALDALRERGLGAGGPLATGAELTVLCDVRTPFEAAARVFGPQKGASASEVEFLTERLERLAAKLQRDPRGVPFTGAAGGLAGGLWAALGARLVAGAGFVLDAVGFDARMRAARAVVTGEGRLDRTSLAGKLTGEVATRARQAGVPCHAIVGRRDLSRFEQRILDLQVVLEAGGERELEAAGQELAACL
jgi:glycerate kinase